MRERERERERESVSVKETRETNKRRQVKLTLKESYSVIIEFRDLAHTEKQFVRHPPQDPENL